MFGLEGSGFVVCLALTLFLIGLVMFYVRQRFYEQESKINQLISIIPVMTEQIQVHEKELNELKENKNSDSVLVNNNNRNSLETIVEENSEDKINVSSSDSESEDETDSDDDTESDDESLSNTENNTNIKNIQLGSEIVNEHKLSVQDIETELSNHLLKTNDEKDDVNSIKVVSLDNNLNDKMDESNDTDSDSDTSTNNDNTLIEDSKELEPMDDIDIPITNSDKIIESFKSNTTEDKDTKEELSIQKIQDINNNEYNNDVDNMDYDFNNKDTNLEEKHLASNIDYSKLALPALRELVAKKGLSSAPSKLKKQDCLNLLQE